MLEAITPVVYTAVVRLEWLLHGKDSLREQPEKHHQKACVEGPNRARDDKQRQDE